MKLYYSKILLFALALNILLTSYYAHNKNKPSITSHHTPRYTSRVLSECDTESSIYDNDKEINSVKEIFERQASQRLREYDERLQEKRQKRKQQRDKNIQKIIQKDKREKSLAERIEKGCLMCGCGLGSVAGSVGLFGGIIINIWKPGALKAAIAAAIAKRAGEISAAAEAARILAGKNAVISGLKQMGISTLGGKDLGSYFTTNTYTDVASITQAVYNQYKQTCNGYSLGKLVSHFRDPNPNIRFCQSVLNPTYAVSKTKKGISDIAVMKTAVQTMVSDAEVSAKAAAQAAEVAEKAKAIKTSTEAIEAASTELYGAIGYSILAILIIVLIMIIIYLILRYRRKKKMKKKAQYTKLLNE
ncbi:rifin PIR protein, putative [Plasmodium reichenowi]|uniref:Rifin PIR protein, putative n=1 Tax=Plasmodium reichenowi TaxID=5854 RepID=A0A2P9DE47_PLARE|nr:rifin PIR protein, putative [Plasmodium reichenowi]